MECRVFFSPGQTSRLYINLFDKDEADGGGRYRDYNDKLIYLLQANSFYNMVSFSKASFRNALLFVFVFVFVFDFCFRFLFFALPCFVPLGQNSRALIEVPEEAVLASRRLRTGLQGSIGCSPVHRASQAVVLSFHPFTPPSFRSFFSAIASHLYACTPVQRLMLYPVALPPHMSEKIRPPCRRKIKSGSSQHCLALPTFGL